MLDRLKKLSMAAAMMVLVAVLAEVLLRTFAPVHLVGSTSWYQYDEELGVLVRPSMHSLRLTDSLNEMRTNALGTINYQEDFEPYEALVFAAGDSYTQGIGVPSDASYPFQLDVMLNTTSGLYEPRYGVVNIGLAAYGMEQAMIVIERYAERIGKPDYILYFGCSNDFEDDRLFESGYRHNHMVDGNPRYGAAAGLLQWATEKSQLAIRLKVAVARIRRGFIVQSPAAGGPRPNVAELQHERFDRLKSLADRLGATLVVSWTDKAGHDAGAYSWLAEWAAANDVRFADWHPLTASIESEMPGLNTHNMHSSGHFRTWVYNVVARAYAQQVLSDQAPEVSGSSAGLSPPNDAGTQRLSR